MTSLSSAKIPLDVMLSSVIYIQRHTNIALNASKSSVSKMGLQINNHAHFGALTLVIWHQLTSSENGAKSYTDFSVKIQEMSWAMR